jgi:hypothetical protein
VSVATGPSVATAPTVEIGYAQQTVSNWWLHDPNETTPELQWPMSVYVYDQMRRQDAQVTSVLRAVTLPVRRTPWRIDPNGARDEVVQLVADDLGLPIVGSNPAPPPRSKDRFSWPEHLRQALLMLPFGHMFFEIVFRVTEDGSRAHLRKLAPRMPRTIERIDVADDGGLISISQYWMRTTERPKPIPADRLVAYVHELEGGNWLGTSILRPAYKNWLLKDRLLRVQAQTIERNGMGIPLYKAQEGATPTDMASGLAMATAWRAGDAAGSATPFGADLVLRGVEGTLPDAEPAIRYHDEQIARAVLAHFLNLGTQTGSWALGTTFADFFTLSLQTLAQQIADTATCHIVEDMVDINFGPDEPAPRVTFDEIGSRQAATAAAIKTLVDAGVIRPDEVLEESSRQQYGLPPADPKTVRQPPAAAPAQPDAGAQLFGDNSAAVAASVGEADPKGSDEPEDDQTWALVTAFAELTGLVHAADWHPEQHLRDRHGKFRDMVTRIAESLTKWHADGGHGDPLGKEFNREQLRRAAVKVGFNPKRGASEGELKALFYDRARTRLGSADMPASATATKKLDSLEKFRAMSAADARDALDLKKVDELKPLLREAGLPVSGRKRDLVDRLVEHMSPNDPNAKAPKDVTEKIDKPSAPTPASRRTAPSLKDLFNDRPDQAHQDKVAKVVATAINGDYPGGLHIDDATGGLVFQPDNASRYAPKGHIEIGGTIKNSDGKEVGYFRRTVTFDGETGKWVATHDRLHVDSNTGTGFAREFNNNLYDWYRRSGIDEVHLDASQIGSYAWATQGFDFGDRDTRKGVREVVGGLGVSDLLAATVPGAHTDSHAALAGRSPSWSAAEAQAQLPLLRKAAKRLTSRTNPISAYELSQVGRKPGQGGKDAWWIGKAAMLASGGWGGVMPLKES